MHAIGTALLIVGLIAFLIGGVQILILAFQTHVLWAVGCLLFPVIVLLYAILHWGKARKPFLLYLAGMIVFLIGASMSGNLSAVLGVNV